MVQTYKFNVSILYYNCKFALQLSLYAEQSPIFKPANSYVYIHVHVQSPFEQVIKVKNKVCVTLQIVVYFRAD